MHVNGLLQGAGLAGAWWKRLLVPRAAGPRNARNNGRDKRPALGLPVGTFGPRGYFAMSLPPTDSGFVRFFQIT
jgi:hypothetical protein